MYGSCGMQAARDASQMVLLANDLLDIADMPYFGKKNSANLGNINRIALQFRVRASVLPRAMHSQRTDLPVGLDTDAVESTVKPLYQAALSLENSSLPLIVYECRMSVSTPTFVPGIFVRSVRIRQGYGPSLPLIIPLHACRVG
eukprot:1178749-Prorocentrum_minimum.AAC.5